MIKKILFATDLSVFTPYSLLHVEALASRFEANIHIVHVVPPLEELTIAVVRSHCSEQVKQEVLNTPHIKGLLETLRENIFEILIREPFDNARLINRVADISVLVGQPSTAILNEAERCQCDLIIIGSHSINSMDGRILGSVAAKVLHLARTPVYMIPMMSPESFYGGATAESRPQRGS